MRQIDREEGVMRTRDGTASPYLRRRLRSYEKAVSQRGIPTRHRKRTEAISSGTPTESRKTAESRSGR